MREARILTWHVHGSYLYYLAFAGHRIFLPVNDERSEGYCGRAEWWPSNIIEVPVADVPRLGLDCILFQSARNYLSDQHEILTGEQRRLPRIYLEHDPPREHPTDTRHPVDDPEILLVHVTRFNQLMWDSNRTPTRVIDHGVPEPRAKWTGELGRGLVVVNGLKKRGRRLGADVFEEARRRVPLDLVGMESERMGGLGEIKHRDLPAFAARYRFFFNPIRYTSLGLAVCEAMMLGMPVIGFATTEMVTAVENGVSGYVDTDLEALIERMLELVDDREKAARLGEGARRRARRRFSIERFARDWDDAVKSVLGPETKAAGAGVAAGGNT